MTTILVPKIHANQMEWMITTIQNPNASLLLSIVEDQKILALLTSASTSTEREFANKLPSLVTLPQNVSLESVLWRTEREFANTMKPIVELQTIVQTLFAILPLDARKSQDVTTKTHVLTTCAILKPENVPLSTKSVTPLVCAEREFAIQMWDVSNNL